MSILPSSASSEFVALSISLSSFASIAFSLAVALAISLLREFVKADSAPCALVTSFCSEVVIPLIKES